MSQSPTFYWHDYETFGTDPQRDRPAQFAGLRTDFELNIIADPLVVYCQPAADMLPQPEACLVTGITPQIALAQGVPEAEFIELIHRELSVPGTCGSGYNSLRFDDEFTRNILYRNFYDPYAREWQNGNSRWDIIDLTRMTCALRPEGIQWPQYENGDVCFRLEKLTEANEIGHDSAHDALSDVQATIAWAKLLKTKQPRLFDYLLNLRNKHQVAQLLNVMHPQPLVHVSSKYAAQRHCTAVVMPVGVEPKNDKAVIVFDLSQDPEQLLTLDADTIKQRVFTATEDLPDGIDRIALKAVHINKCPALAPLKTLKPKDAERLNIDLSVCQKNFNKLAESKHLKAKIQQVFTRPDHDAIEDPDLMIYSGGFFSNQDKVKMAEVRGSAPDKLVGKDFGFEDSRLDEMLFRYRARNFPDTLNQEEQQLWANYCQHRICSAQGGGSIVLPAFKEKIILLREQYAENDIKLKVLNDLQLYADNLTFTVNKV